MAATVAHDKVTTRPGFFLSCKLARSASGSSRSFEPRREKRVVGKQLFCPVLGASRIFRFLTVTQTRPGFFFPLDILDLLDRPIAFQRCFVTLTGSINAALMLSQAVYWANRCDERGGWFYKTQADWEEETGLTRREQETARKILTKLEVMEEELRGIPAKLHFRVDSTKLRDALKKVQVRQTSMAESAKQGSLFPPNTDGGKRPAITETNREHAEKKPSIKSKRLSDEDFIQSLKDNPAFKGIDINRELLKMDAWLITKPGRKKTRQFIVNWLNKIDQPLSHEQTPAKTNRSGNGAVGTSNERVVDAY